MLAELRNLSLTILFLAPKILDSTSYLDFSMPVKDDLPAVKMGICQAYTCHQGVEISFMRLTGEAASRKGSFSPQLERKFMQRQAPPNGYLYLLIASKKHKRVPGIFLLSSQLTLMAFIRQSQRFMRELIIDSARQFHAFEIHPSMGRLRPCSGSVVNLTKVLTKLNIVMFRKPSEVMSSGLLKPDMFRHAKQIKGTAANLLFSSYALSIPPQIHPFSSSSGFS